METLVAFNLVPTELESLRRAAAVRSNGHAQPAPPSRDASFLRHCAWEIGERKPAEAYTPTENHVGLAMVSPAQGFSHWRILPAWINDTAWRKGDAWHHCRMVLRLYDVSYIHFNGFNAHRIQDLTIHALCGQTFFTVPRPGTWQLAEVGFVLRSGEFVPAARSQAVSFASDAVTVQGDQAALLVEGPGRIENIGNLWDQERILRERRKPRIRKQLRIATFAFSSLATGQADALARFVSELAAGQRGHGHEVHVFLPATERLAADCQSDGVHYHPLPFHVNCSPLANARNFARAAEGRLRDLPEFDLFHAHEWMTGLAPWLEARPSVLSLSSIETTRRNGGPVSQTSLAIQHAERDAAQVANCLLAPDWLRPRIISDLEIDPRRVHPFAMEGRMPNEWEAPLDLGEVKNEIQVGPMDRLVLFVGPLEHATGVDLLLEALPVLLQRAGNVRLAYVGMGDAYGHLQRRAGELQVAYAVRLLGHVDGPRLTRLLRAAECLVLPSRYRVPFDDAVVDLVRRAARPVVTTHAGPAYLVRHEETGLITYDNPGSMVWALDRILGDPHHAYCMGQNGRRSDGQVIDWKEAARYFLEICAATFPELSETCLQAGATL
jgi:glycosyltransferase involved in cell wall biosynthesis